MFWTFKLSFDSYFIAFWATFFQKLGKILINFLVTLLTSIKTISSRHLRDKIASVEMTQQVQEASFNQVIY